MPLATPIAPASSLRCYDGKHVEIINYRRRRGAWCSGMPSPTHGADLKAAAIVDLRTLTGACGVALGDYARASAAADDQLKNRVLAAAEAAGEKIYHPDLRGAQKPDSEPTSRHQKFAVAASAALAPAAAFPQDLSPKTTLGHTSILP